MYTSPDFLHVTKMLRPLGILEHLCGTTVVSDGSVSEQHKRPQPAPITRWKAKYLSWTFYLLNTNYLKVRYCVPWSVVSLPHIMHPVSGGSSFSHSPTYELWVAGRLTDLDTGESVWVEREQPWEQCLPATLETISKTCQPIFRLKSQNCVVLYCNPARNCKTKKQTENEHISAVF